MSANTSGKDTTTVQEKMFEVYSSSISHHKVLRPDGKAIHFIDGKLITDNAEDIEYLDDQIKRGGLRWIKKGEPVKAADADPMATLRRKIEEDAVARYIAAQKAIADAANIANTGESSTEQPKLNPASSAVLANLKANSNSGQ